MSEHQTFRSAEDYRDHLPCSGCKTCGSKAIDDAHLLNLIDRAMSFVWTQADRDGCAASLLIDMRKALGR